MTFIEYFDALNDELRRSGSPAASVPIAQFWYESGSAPDVAAVEIGTARYQSTQPQERNMRVYGGCIEPGGMDLEDASRRDECPNCGNPNAHHWFSERCEGGSINTYSGWSCDACGDSGGDADDDEP